MHSLVSLYFINGMFEVGKKWRGPAGGGGVVGGKRGKIRGGRGLQYFLYFPYSLQVVWPLVFDELSY